ncbi:hypothetical protein K490DRAFT_69613 [Saccharata proteae CBS 121410]|uniref:Uncharacterized protein n=1 Tax=Saccharata proteae CBS 121410 TaxID=1314787 RepID=A0A9P4HN68_9PEZI|nr:hypothetical protein K490DRAFT_69613 [Saccharata proteae CBS 121410]
MLFTSHFALYLSFYRIVRADGLTDFSTLKSTVSNAVTTVQTSMNISLSNSSTTVSTSTADLLANITSRIQMSTSSLESDQDSFIGDSSLPMDDPYQDYLLPLNNLAAAIKSQGHSFHAELNAPVFTNLQNLARVVQTYGSTLAHANITTRESTILTMRIGSAIVDAERTWDQTGNYPGKVRRRTWCG